MPDIFLRENTSGIKIDHIQEVSSTFRKSGLTYVLRKRNKVAVLYELFLGLNSVGYEVCVLKILPEETILGRQYPMREGLPSDEEFGMEGSKAFYSYDFVSTSGYLTDLNSYISYF
jgi:hypothetical protein